jgi:hypothetical protein
MISDRTRTIVLAVVTVIWAINFLAGVVIPDYKPDQAINGIFMAIAGTLFALNRSHGNGNGHNNGNGKALDSSKADNNAAVRGSTTGSEDRIQEGEGP